MNETLNNAALARPKLTMPPLEEAAVVEAYSGATVVLEYGAGGSTLIAAEAEGKTIFSVESDAEWLAKMQAYFAMYPPTSRVHLHHGDIGPTKGWGYPVDSGHMSDWPNYPISVWDLPEFLHPDVVLIDGRFRIACFLTTLFRIRQPVTLLWDDYTSRPDYFEIESLVRPVALIGRMARFEITPMAIPPERLLWIIKSFMRAR